MFSLITVASKQYPHDIHMMSNRSIFDMCHGQKMEYTPIYCRRMVINPLIRVGISLPFFTHYQDSHDGMYDHKPQYA
jgi:hypothetical protein